MESVLAAFEGGSAAFGRDDEYSDLDLQVVAAKGEAAEVIVAIEMVVENRFVLNQRFELPQPTWHGAFQCFYSFKAEPYMLLDLVVIEHGVNWTLTEEERHGIPVILFDKGGYIVTTAVDREKIEKEITVKLAKIEPMVAMFSSFVDKSLDRGLGIEAMHFYQRMVQTPLIDVLRMKYDPTRHDFSARYLHVDLPKEIHDQLEGLFFITSFEDLRVKKRAALALFNETLAELKADA
jgi:hypothetical protein